MRDRISRTAGDQVEIRVILAFPSLRNVKQVPASFSAFENNGGGRSAGRELSRRDEAKPLVRLRKMGIRGVYAGLRSFPPGRDWKLQISSETPLLVNG